MAGRKEGSHGGGNEVGCGGDIITLTSPSRFSHRALTVLTRCKVHTLRVVMALSSRINKDTLTLDLDNTFRETYRTR